MNSLVDGSQVVIQPVNHLADHLVSRQGPVIGVVDHQAFVIGRSTDCVNPALGRSYWHKQIESAVQQQYRQREATIKRHTQYYRLELNDC